MTQVSETTEVYHEATKEQDDAVREEDVAPETDEGDIDGVFPEQYQQVIAQVAMSMEWLTDLRTTVERRGVSAYDMRALREIRGSLEGVGVEFAPTPSLEHYPLGSYTDERSSVNMEPALESISRTIITTIKTWIRKLVDYIKRIYQWAKRHFKRESSFERAFSVYPEIIATAREGRDRLNRIRSNRPSQALIKDIERLRQDFLSGDTLKRSPLQLAALNVPDQTNKALRLEQDTLAYTRKVEAQVDQVEAALTRDPRSVRTVDDSPSLVGAMILDEIKVLQAEMPQRDYLRRHVKPEYFELPLKSVSWKISPYDYLNDMHEELVKQLGQIRQIGDDVENVDQLSRIFTDISRTSISWCSWHSSSMVSII